MNDLIKNLKNSNLKVTPQRLAIYSYLYHNHTHPNAETIYNFVKEDNLTISLATVYKTLKTLRDYGLIQEINVGEDSFRYDLQTTPHSHIICTKCNSIIDYFVENDIVSNIKDKINNEIDFDVQASQMYFYGVCKNCRAK